jgi:hypothetical protein
MTNNLPLLADELGKLDLAKKSLEARIAAIKTELKAAGAVQVLGVNFEVNIGKSIRASLDQALVKKEMGQEWFDDHSSLSEIETVRIKARSQAVVAL